MAERKDKCCSRNYVTIHEKQEILYTKENETYQCVEPLKDLAKRLQDKGFVFSSRSYLVNLEHIRKVEKNMICITDDHRISLSRNKCTEIRKQHFEWKMHRANG